MSTNFNMLGRTYRVMAQADAPDRRDFKDILKIRVRNTNGDTVPLAPHHGSQYRRPVSRPALQPLSRGRDRRSGGGRLLRRASAIETMAKLAAEGLPDGSATSGRRSRSSRSGPAATALFAFALAVVFVFLVLAAQFESLTPAARGDLIVPMCLVASISGRILRGQDNNILTQVGFIVLIGLAARTRS